MLLLNTYSLNLDSFSCGGSGYIYHLCVRE